MFCNNNNWVIILLILFVLCCCNGNGNFCHIGCGNDGPCNPCC